MSEQQDWQATNEQHLAAMLEWLRLKLQKLALDSSKGRAKKILPGTSSEPSEDDIEQARQTMFELEQQQPPPAFNLLAHYLGLSNFDCQVLALCVGVALDTRIGPLCAQALDNENSAYPTFGLAFMLFDDPDWSALSPHGALRYWRLLEINQPGAQPLTSAALAADERIVNYLKGLNYLDDRLAPLLEPLATNFETAQTTGEPLPASQQQQVDSVVARLQHSTAEQSAPVVELQGPDAASKRLIAARTSSALALNLQALNLKSLPSQLGDSDTFNRLWQRESLLMPLALYIDIEAASDSEKETLRRFLESNTGVVFVAREEGRLETARNCVTLEVNKPTPEEQQQLWMTALQGEAQSQSQAQAQSQSQSQSQLLSQPRHLAEQFSFAQHEIRQLAKVALDECRGNKSALNGNLWQACRIAARAGMEKLARRIDSKATWQQLVLPPEQKNLLQQITDQVAQRNRVYEDWGFREQMNRGLGINALFCGESGTGKTMAAEVIANALKLDLYRIDLSSVVSKYIGETEKNLRKLFNAAEDSGAILFFDEADALFGKRSEVKDSHDRYANIEINYLLQRMESYRGLAILATNLKSALDKAFVRRLRFIVDFPFPGIEERAEIWHRVFPPQTPVSGNLDCQRLAKLSLTGGNIHNVALNAAFLAAQKNSEITMPLVLDAARIEYKKLERPSKESDFIWQGPTGAVA